MSKAVSEPDYDLWLSVVKTLDDYVEILDDAQGSSAIMSYVVISGAVGLGLWFFANYTIGYLIAFLAERGLALPEGFIFYCLSVIFVIYIWVSYKMIARKTTLKKIPVQYTGLITALHALEHCFDKVNGPIFKHLKNINERLETFFSSAQPKKEHVALKVSMGISQLNGLVEIADDTNKVKNLLAEIQNNLSMVQT